MARHTIRHATVRARRRVARSQRFKAHGLIVRRNPSFKRERGLYFQGRVGGMGVVINAPGYRVV